MMNREFFPEVSGEFDARVRSALAALPEKRRARRMTAGKIAAIALAAVLCLGGGVLAASGAFPLLFPRDGGEAVSDYVQTPAEPVAENEDWRLTVDSVLFDESSLTGVVSLRLENLKGDGVMPFKTLELLPEYQNQPDMSWSHLSETGWTDPGDCYFLVMDESEDSGFTGPFYLDTVRSTENVYYLEAALIAYSDYELGDALKLNMYQLGKDGTVLSVALPEPVALPSVRSSDGDVILSQIGLRVELDTDETAVDAVDYAALRMTDGSEIVIIDKANNIDRTLYALGGSTSVVNGMDGTVTTGVPVPDESVRFNVATYLLAVTPELENVSSVVINGSEYALQ